MQFFMNGAAFASFVPRLPEIRTRNGVSLDGLGLLITIALTVGLLGSLAAPRVIDWLGSRTTLIVGAAVLIAGLPVLGVATVPLVFVLGYCAMSVTDGMVDVSMNLQGSWLSTRRHAPVMNRLHGLWSLGTVVGGIAASRAAASGVSLTTHFNVAAVALALSLVFVGRGLLPVDEGHTEPPSAARQPRVKRTPELRMVLMLLALAGACAITVELVSSDWAAFRLSEDFDAAPGFSGLGYVAFTVGMTVGRLFGDAALVRLGNDRMLQMAIALAGVGLAGASLAPDRWVVLTGYLIAGVGISTFFPKLYDDAAKFRGRRGAGLAWLRTGSGVTALVMPTLVGVLSASRLSVGTATAIVTLPAVIGFAFVARRSASTRTTTPPDVHLGSGPE